ncbi:MAG TPA: diguanylate cyclase [Candidatus Sulfotelmatobacter sp.]|nr:diguanylate cyclase [Candidatus Sulfotelmatobacter sp.]
MPAPICWNAIPANSTLFHERHDFVLLAAAIIFALIAAWLAIRVMRGTAEREAEARFRLLAESIPQIVWTAGPDGATDYINQRWYEMTGVPKGSRLGNWVECVHPDDRRSCLARWQDCLRTGEIFEVEYRLRDARRGYRWYLDRATPMRDASEMILKWFGICTDIDDHKRMQELLERQVQERTAELFEANARLRQETIRDPLTRLYNRRYLEDVLERESRRAVRAEGKMGLLMLDLDHFKRINDTSGHDAGDTVLREVSAFLMKSVRAEDVVCRYGGEEFVVILPMADRATSHARAERIRSRLRDLEILHNGRWVGRVTLSAGVAALPDHGIMPAELLAAADAALYRAKREGRDRVMVAGATQEIRDPVATGTGSGMGTGI